MENWFSQRPEQRSGISLVTGRSLQRLGGHVGWALEREPSETHMAECAAPEAGIQSKSPLHPTQLAKPRSNRDDRSLVQALQAPHSMPRIRAQLRVCRLHGTGRSPASPPTAQRCRRMSRFPGGLRRKLLAGQPFRFEDAWEKSGERSLPPTHLRKANRWVKPVTQDEQMDFFFERAVEAEAIRNREGA